jgi:hypothetical protein
VAPVVADAPVGAITGQRYPGSLLRPDRRGFQPRIGVALRPVPGSSLVIRAGYGVYRNTNVYQPIALLLAQQPPLSKTLSVENGAANPLTLANGFTADPARTANTFAVDPDFRVGSAQNWQVLVQRDLPASLTVTATYLGTRGSGLMLEFLPNTYPSGAQHPCPGCPAGFVYLTSRGSSNRQAGQFQVRRRLRNGLMATVQYTLAAATDDAGAFTGVAVTGGAIAQDWIHPEAERGPSNFDQRHLLTAQFQYTTGAGISGGTLLDGVKGSLFKGWTVSSQLTAGSGLPLTPVYLTSVTGTGVTGTLRPDVIGDPRAGAPPGAYVNPAAYAAPTPGRWGRAGRNSIRGPAQFALDAGIARTFLWGDSQDTLYSLAKDTGGRAMFDDNDLSRGIAQAARAVSSYYIIGYYSTHAANDGRFHRVRVTLSGGLSADLSFRQGYFADKEFAKFTAADKERQLEEALMLENPVTDIAIAMEINYFQLNRAEYFVPVAVKIPGSELALARRRGAARTLIDFIGEIKDDYGITIQNVRDKLDIKLTDATAAQLATRPIQYETGFTLLPGKYVIKFGQGP